MPSLILDISDTTPGWVADHLIAFSRQLDLSEQKFYMVRVTPGQRRYLKVNSPERTPLDNPVRIDLWGAIRSEPAGVLLATPQSVLTLVLSQPSIGLIQARIDWEPAATEVAELFLAEIARRWPDTLPALLLFHADVAVTGCWCRLPAEPLHTQVMATLEAMRQAEFLVETDFVRNSALFGFSAAIWTTIAQQPQLLATLDMREWRLEAAGLYCRLALANQVIEPAQPWLTQLHTIFEQARLLSDLVEPAPIVVKHAPAGRPVDDLYDRAWLLMTGQGYTHAQARDWYFHEQGITSPTKYDESSFEQAIRRRRKKANAPTKSPTK